MAKNVFCEVKVTATIDHQIFSQSLSSSGHLYQIFRNNCSGMRCICPSELSGVCFFFGWSWRVWQETNRAKRRPLVSVFVEVWYPEDWVVGSGSEITLVMVQAGLDQAMITSTSWLAQVFSTWLELLSGEAALFNVTLHIICGYWKWQFL